MQIGIGISAYNDSIMTERLVRSIINKTNGKLHTEYELLIWDDGTNQKNPEMYSRLVDLANLSGIFLMKNDINKGIPYTWNRIAEFYNTDILVILNNDLITIDPNWLKYVEYFLINNDRVGIVGFPLINSNQFSLSGKDGKGDDIVIWDQNISKYWGELPGRVGCPVGCCFALKKDVWKKVKNPDGSIGYWESLTSFHEETHMGFALWQLGYYSYMLNWPPIVHFGGQTFCRNQELIERPVNWDSEEFKTLGISKSEYINLISKSKIYPWGNKIVWTNDKGQEVTDRMAFSRYQFAKYWKVLDSYDMPQVPVHNNILKINEREKIPIKWLDKELKERVDMI